MNILLLCIGHMKDSSLKALQEEYRKRLKPFCRLDILEVKEEPGVHTERTADVKRALDREADRALSSILPSDTVILLDLHGRELSSEAFAAELLTWQLRSSRLVFVIAGSLGPGAALVRRADARWKLSDLTFTHLMTRILVLEQIYRGFMINAGRSYHK